MRKISVEKKFWDYIDFKLLIPVLLLTIIGFVSIYSATATLPNNNQFENQIFAFGVSFIIMLFFALTPEKWLHYLSIPIYSIAILLLIATLLFGTTIYGTRGWLVIAGRSFQASEFAKLATLMAFAFIFSNVNVSIKYLQTFLIVIGTFLLPTVLILLQPDVGTATVFFTLLLGILYWSGFNTFAIYTILALPILLLLALKGGVFPWIGLGIFVVIALFFKRKLLSTIIAIGLSLIVVFSAPIIYENLQPHQKARISTFLDPSSNKKDTGYNVAQSVLAVGSGGITGKGFMQGTQTQLRYIPMQSTDFIFSVPAEEFGLIGSIIVLG
ncbi:MAG TPA: rod shape-determining protein RodA, partial [Bacteroidota bacterium]|nr:rod shape-determining protein RodA [Bacteroidota bacterium]